MVALTDDGNWPWQEETGRKSHGGLDQRGERRAELQRCIACQHERGEGFICVKKWPWLCTSKGTCGISHSV